MYLRAAHQALLPGKDGGLRVRLDQRHLLRWVSERQLWQ